LKHVVYKPMIKLRRDCGIAPDVAAIWAGTKGEK
jgi:hypothetical protein